MVWGPRLQWDGLCTGLGASAGCAVRVQGERVSGGQGQERIKTDMVKRIPTRGWRSLRMRPRTRDMSVVVVQAQTPSELSKADLLSGNACAGP